MKKNKEMYAEALNVTFEHESNSVDKRVLIGSVAPEERGVMEVHGAVKAAYSKMFPQKKRRRLEFGGAR